MLQHSPIVWISHDSPEIEEVDKPKQSQRLMKEERGSALVKISARLKDEWISTSLK